MLSQAALLVMNYLYSYDVFRTVYLMLLLQMVTAFEAITNTAQKDQKGDNGENGFAADPIEQHVLNEQDAPSSCKFGNCSQYYIIDHVLNNLTSNGVISITHDVILILNITLANLKNISVIGYDSPTVTCRNSTGLNIMFSHDYVIEGITWNGCGSQYAAKLVNSGIQFLHSSNIIIKTVLSTTPRDKQLHY